MDPILRVIAQTPKNPNDLARLSLVSMTLADEQHIEINPSFTRFANSKASLEFLRHIGYQGAGSGPPPAQLVVFFMYCQWAKAGLPVFRPSESLAAGLALTDIDNVPTDEWKWPFDCFLIHVPYEFWVMKSPADGSPDPVCMMIVSKMETMFHEPAAMMLMIGRNGSLSFSQVMLPAEGSMFEDWFKIVTEQNKLPVGGMDTFDLEPTEQTSMTNGWRLMTNLCFYVNERGRGQRQNTYTTKRAKRRIPSKSSMPIPSVWILGQEIKLDRELITAAKNQALGSPAWTVSKRFVVRGHYREQPYGPGRSLRKRLWIESFWKGPREGATLTHLYTDGDPK